jgi:hypothetical protein
MPPPKVAKKPRKTGNSHLEITTNEELTSHCSDVSRLYSQLIKPLYHYGVMKLLQNKKASVRKALHVYSGVSPSERQPKADKAPTP